MKSQEVRRRFLEFFNNKQHKIVPSAPMVIKDDPTLMFTNAGMNQFKEYFLGNTIPQSQRVTDSQKCLRVSGKHNDLEEVGKDTYHHTMFEMLGNWSFGLPSNNTNGYFKEEAIAWSWEFLTEVCGIDKDILYVTIFEGSDDADALEKDNEAYEFWSKIVDKDRILLGNKKDNFWEMGDQGPCGPCSEIHVDIRSKEEKASVSGASLVNMDHPQVVEIWNLVFMQYNRKANGVLENLPAKHVDTGMGFERLCMVLQNVTSNYDTDVFTPTIKVLEELTNTTYGKSEETDIAIRVIADHIRAVAFSIADGQLPSNTGAGYVIRRILRRAVRYGFTFLTIKEPFMYRLVSVLCDTMGDAFTELKNQKGLIENVIKEEESSFLRTLEQGLLLLDTVISETKGTTVNGEKSFELYDTYGFPIDLTALILSERGLLLDEKGFEAAMAAQKKRSRSASEVAKDDWVAVSKTVGQEFVGYDVLQTETSILKYRKVTSKKEGALYQIVLATTPFYPEGGGQVGDVGLLKTADGNEIKVLDTKKENNEIIQVTKQLPKQFDGVLVAVVHAEKRVASARNHTATHLLHQALRKVLGTHVEQKGSAVNSKNLRFDFSHFSKVSAEELVLVEDFVNARISEQLQLEEGRNVPVKEAMEKGAMALFGEKYGEAVRTIQFGDSIELCGGTHVKNTADIWHFKLMSEGAVASGIRRIEAITGDAVKAYYATSTQALQHIKVALNNSQDALKSVTSLLDENAKLKKEIEQLLKEKAKNLKGDLAKEISEFNGVQFLAKQVDLDAAGIKDLAFELGSTSENMFLLFASAQDGKAVLSCYISKELVASKGLNAGTIVRELGKHIQGGGGGQPFFATAGGKNPAGIADALTAAKSYITA